MATRWSLDPTAKTSIVEPIILASRSRKEDFMRHPPVIAPASLGLAPNKLRHDAKAPMLHEIIGRAVIGVGKRPQMGVTPLRREFSDRQCFQFIHLDIHVRQNRAFDRPWRVDHNAAHLGSGTSKFDRVGYPTNWRFLEDACRRSD